MKRAWVQLLAAGFMLSGFGWAQDQPAADPPDEPGQAVARISLVNGDVSVRRGDTSEPVAAANNAPLIANDHLLTAGGSRAEIQFDFANMLRLAQNTEVGIADLQANRFQVQLGLGTVTLSRVRDSNADVEVDTPNVSVRPMARGEYRITVREDGQSEITVRYGQAEVYTPSGTQQLTPGQTMLVRGDANSPQFQTVAAIPVDNWDRWNEDRDRKLDRTRAYQYVSPDVYGAEDLDSAGQWVNDPSYGYVWSPYGMSADWAPYRDGRWVWMDFYGWTWVSYEPWGWAPYHYGRWFWGPRYGWCWYPGGIHSHHFWRPALVAFFGFGHGGGVGFGFGNVGWVPLAPHELFHPWYGRGFHGRDFHENIRMVNNVNVYNTYRNARVPRGVTGIGAGDFGRGHRGYGITDGQIRNVGLVRGSLPVVPARESVRFSDRNVRTANLPRTQPRQFYSPRGTPQTNRISFEQQRQGMERSIRGNQGAAPGFQRSDAPGWRQAPGQTAPGSGGSWRTFGGAPTRTDSPRVNTPSAPNDRGGNWRTFGSRPGDPPTRIDRQPDSTYRGGGNTPRPSNESIRINRPIVRERSAPAPQYQRPTYQRSAPAPQVQRPTYSGGDRSYSRGGGGGNSSRSESRSSGGGGGSHSSGGGGGSRGGGGGSHSGSRR